METKIIFWGSSRAIVGVSCPTRNLECIAVSHRRTANGWQPKQRCWQRRLSRIKRNEAGGTKSKAHPKKAKRKWENPTLRAQRMSSFFWVKDGTFPRQKIFCQKIGIFSLPRKSQPDVTKTSPVLCQDHCARGHIKPIIARTMGLKIILPNSSHQHCQNSPRALNFQSEEDKVLSCSIWATYSGSEKAVP